MPRRHHHIYRIGQHLNGLAFLPKISHGIMPHFKQYVMHKCHFVNANSASCPGNIVASARQMRQYRDFFSLGDASIRAEW